MVQLDERNVRTYLERRFGGSARILGISVLGQEPGAGDLKGYGYGVPVKVEYELSGQRRSAVLETVTPGPFGHEHMADRAQILLWSHAAFNRLPRHVHSLDVGGFSKDGALLSLGTVEELALTSGRLPEDHRRRGRKHHLPGRGVSAYVNGTLNSEIHQFGLWLANAPKDTETLGLSYQLQNWDMGFFTRGSDRCGTTTAASTRRFQFDPFNITNLYLNYTIKSLSEFSQTKIPLIANNLFLTTGHSGLSGVETGIRHIQPRGARRS